jgi:hypothetical protein
MRLCAGFLIGEACTNDAPAFYDKQAIDLQPPPVQPYIPAVLSPLTCANYLLGRLACRCNADEAEVALQLRQGCHIV